MIKTISIPLLLRPWDEKQSDENQDLLLVPFSDMSQCGRSAETPLITGHVRVTQCITIENVTNLLCMLQAI